MPRVLNRRAFKEIPDGAVYIGRPTKWGNPFIIGVDGDRLSVIEKYKAWFPTSGLSAQLGELKGRDLVCFCAPHPCHGDFLIEVANQE